MKALIFILLLFLLASCSVPYSANLSNKKLWEKPAQTKMKYYSHNPSRVY